MFIKPLLDPIFLRNSKNNVHNQLCHDAEIFLRSRGGGSMWLVMLTFSMLLAVGPSGGLHTSGEWSGVTCSVWRIHVKFVFPSLRAHAHTHTSEARNNQIFTCNVRYIWECLIFTTFCVYIWKPLLFFALNLFHFSWTNKLYTSIEP